MLHPSLNAANRLAGGGIIRCASPSDAKGWLFRTSRGHDGNVFIRSTNGTVGRMIRRSSRNRGHRSPDRKSQVPRPGITAYLFNGGALERAKEMAAHESPR